MIPSGLHDNIIFLVSKVSKTFHQKMQQAFKEAGYQITAEQFSILAHLWYKDGLRQQEIAEGIDRDKTTVSRVLDTMVKQDLIQRVAGKDKRERLIFLTKHGNEIQDRLVQISGALYMQTIDKVDQPELVSAIETLTKLINNLE